MYDIIEKLRNSIIQHGSHNNRIYLMKLHEGDVPDILQGLDLLARNKGYGKILARVPASLISGFTRKGYRREATVPGFFRGVDDMVFMAKYYSPKRCLDKHKGRIQDIITIAHEKNAHHLTHNNEEWIRIRRCLPSDALQMSLIYKQIFQTYPFPIYDAAYLVDTMRNHGYSFCAMNREKMVALASTEIDSDSLSAEMTDFAALPCSRGRGIAVRLLEQMEEEMVRMGIRTAYTIARALSHGMNKTFGKMGYTYSGTLTNNSNISGSIESMNVWHKNLKR
ncbi:MAG: putative beta-lysine N-acetyltransferase [Thermodesulfobacteriota bacterium]|nr:putative beta-lysine N-acetyltransferase [Thermodesulfobacteriota bacterium]